MMMVNNKEYLLGQRGKPPHGKCVDCKRDIVAMEMYVKCPNCEENMICVDCVDKHDHMHNAIVKSGAQFDKISRLLSAAERN